MTKPHNPNCAIVRQGNTRAWCDCGVDTIETLTVEVNKLGNLLLETAERNAREIVRLEIENAAMRAAGDRLAGYAGHDVVCKLNTRAFGVTKCNCGYTEAVKGWQEARGDD